jgi:hypothetical protein
VQLYWPMLAPTRPGVALVHTTSHAAGVVQGVFTLCTMSLGILSFHFKHASGSWQVRDNCRCDIQSLQ